MNISSKHISTLPSGEKLYLFSLRNSRGTEVCITNYGGIITSFKIPDAGGRKNDIVLGLEKVEDYFSKEYMKSCPYFGAAIGRYANRIAGSRFMLDGKQYLLPANDGEFQLHGGAGGFHTRVWNVLDSRMGSNSSLLLNYLSKDGEEGYPGNLEVSLQFTLTENDELIYEYTATTDAPTAVNLSHHSYFNLDKEKKTVGSHLVCIHSDVILAQDGYQITGELQSVSDSPFDFREMRRIDKSWDPEQGYDHCFVLNRPDDSSMYLAAEARSESSGLLLEVFTTEPCIQFYTGKYIPKITGKKGKEYSPFMGFCLETQNFINAVNIPQFPGTILRSGDTYFHKTMYRISQ